METKNLETNAMRVTTVLFLYEKKTHTPNSTRLHDNFVGDDRCCFGIEGIET